MKYLKLSSVLVALFFAVGCGSKSVERGGDTTRKTTEARQATDSQDFSETVTDVGSVSLPEGGFMPDVDMNGDGYSEGNVSNDSALDDMDNPYANASVDVNRNDGYSSGMYMLDDDDSSGGYSDMLEINSLMPIYFDFDRYDIRPDMKDYIRANVAFIKEKGIKTVVLQGNTDEFGGDEYNTALGLKRAVSVRDALVTQGGLPQNMFSTISYGMHKPMCREKTAECYAKNRRTDVVEKP